MFNILGCLINFVFLFVKIMQDATEKLPADKPVTIEDAKAVIGAEIRNSTNMATTPAGVDESQAAAAGLNQNGE
ncbi:hypothetical protein ACFX19_031687 [Malus domestica]